MLEPSRRGLPAVVLTLTPPLAATTVAAQDMRTAKPGHAFADSYFRGAR